MKIYIVIDHDDANILDLEIFRSKSQAVSYKQKQEKIWGGKWYVIEKTI